jgi:hydroxymethylpyrimidine/phosphomethylpyrimidine kinase
MILISSIEVAVIGPRKRFQRHRLAILACLNPFPLILRFFVKMTFSASNTASKTVLTIAGFDPSSGAGVTADLMVFAAHGLFGISCITALTVQSTRGVRSSHPVDTQILASTLRCLAEDLAPAGIKIGMLGTSAATLALVDFLTEFRETWPNVPVVLDPVVRSSSGSELLEPEGVEILRTRLLPLADWVTPNIDELALLSGTSVEDHSDVQRAARMLQQISRTSEGAISRNPIIVFATGGHLVPPDDLLLIDGSEPRWLSGKHIASNSTHGTGCALSSALLSRLVLGDEPYEAAKAAKKYVAEAIRRAVPRGSGKGPLNLGWPLRSETT